ncbi:leucine-rich repeat domain-containing protein [uncultured Duncaniella sp.]|uniref:leucine-rich repeat domain-containing protein n=1 Tax=uncultured Duncaniella sp. TaxID=2768039 RepID=UPI0025A9CFD7|nr:leucine-rich repeat domain-containing protein [uncultured Duncaniella sp.]
MQTIVYQCDTAMPAQKLPNCCLLEAAENAFEGCTALQRLYIDGPYEKMIQLYIEAPLKEVFTERNALVVIKDKTGASGIKLDGLTIGTDVDEIEIGGYTTDPTGYISDMSISISKIHVNPLTWINLKRPPIVLPETAEKWQLYDLDGTQISKLDYTLTQHETVDNRNAFCETLSEVYLPENIKKISSTAFSNCVNLSTVKLSKGLRQIDSQAFENCIVLSKINLPIGLSEIGNRAFSGCHSLTEINIPYGTTHIGNGAFGGCSLLLDENNISGIKAVYLPQTLREIGEDAFLGCETITELHVPDLNTWMNIRLHNIDSNPLSSSALRTVVPDKYNPKNLYINNEPLKSIVIPDSITVIEQSKFMNCSALEVVCLHDSIKIIEDNAFSGCTNLKSLQLPDKIEIIGKDAFSYCENLSGTINLNNTKSLGEAAFNHCSAIEEIIMSPYINKIGYSTFSGCSLLTFPALNNIEEISAKAFKDNQCNTLTLPKKLIYISNDSFSDCQNLTELTIEDSETPLYYKPFVFVNCTRYVFHNSPLEKIYIGRDFSKRNEGMDSWQILGSVPTLKELTIGKFVKELSDINCSLSTHLRTIESHAITPPIMNEFTDEQYATIKVYVNPKALEAYRNAPVWKNFLNINPTSAIDEISSETPTVIKKSYFDIHGHEITNPLFGIFILKESLSDGSTRVKKVKL